MRHNLSRTGLAVGVLFVLGGCGGSESTAPTTFTVQYRLTQTGVVFDSLKYDDGHGTLVKVLSPTNGWVVTIPVTSVGSVEAHAWGTGSAGGSAKLKEAWTLAGVSAQADSSIVTTTSPVVFALHVPKHTF